MLRASIFVLIALFLIIGCDDDSNPVTLEQPSIYTIQLTGLPESVTSPHGVSHDIAFQITVINDSNNQVVSGASVNLFPTGSGTITPASSTTNVNGMVEAVYSFEMPEGKSAVTIFITADKQSANASIDLHGTARPAELLLAKSDTTYLSAYGESVSFDLRAVVFGENGMRVSGVNVLFEVQPQSNADTLFGTFIPIVKTDENGWAITTFNSQGGAGNLILNCSVYEGEDFVNLRDEWTISVIQAGPPGGTITITSDVEYVYADRGVTTAFVTAVLRDLDNLPVVGAAVTFTSNNNGAISSPITTDSIGIGRAVFSDVGLPSFNRDGERAPSEIHAIYEPFGLNASLEIDIRPLEFVDNILLYTGKRNLYTNDRADSTWVRAVCYLNPERTQVAPRGTPVTFEVVDSIGSFSNVTVPVGYDGVAETIYFVNRHEWGGARIQAKVVNDVDGVDTTIYSNEVIIDIRYYFYGGPPANITVSSNPTVLRIGEVGEQSRIVVTVTDSFGNLVRDGSVTVLLSATLGTINPPSLQTDTGRAVAILRPGVEAGVSIITATIQGYEETLDAQTAVSFISGGGSSIQLSADPLEVPVGTHSLLSATVRDANGNLVEIPTAVVFELITNGNPPEEGNINGNDPHTSDTTATSNGVALATFNAGTRTGPQLFRAYTIDNNGQRTDVETTLTTVTVVNGPPAILSLGYEDDARDAGGGSWEIPISAQIMDQHRNRVRRETTVSFRVDPVGAIESHCITRNGLAVVDLNYHSENTFDEVTVTAYILTEDDSISSELTFQLPLQRGELELHVDPENGMIDGDEMLDFRVWSILRDGHGVVINDAPIMFGANRAQFYYDRGGINRPNFEPFAPDPVRRLTGSGNDGDTPNARMQDDDPNGNAVVWLRGDAGDFFLDPFTQEITFQIGARVEGYNDVRAEPEFVFITRQE